MADFPMLPRSALHSVGPQGRYGSATGRPGVSVRIVEQPSLAFILPAPGMDATCLSRLAATFGFDLGKVPERRRVAGDGVDLMWSGPNRYLAVGNRYDDLPARLQLACGDCAAVVDHSDASFFLRLTGPSVRKTLAKGISIDLHPRVFQVGETALVQLCHLQVQLVLVDDAPTFHLVGPRSAALDVWDWLLSSAGPFGVEWSRVPAAAFSTA